MTYQQAKEYISRLSYEEKKQLNDLLISLEQKRQPSASHQEKESKADE
jgi:hypothetical protein